MDKAKLLGPRTATESGMPEGEVAVPGLGTVRVRGLSRYEVMVMRKATDNEHIEGSRVLVIEQKMLAMAMVDPVLSEAEVAQWQQHAMAGELDPVVQRVQELSGMADDATKSGEAASGE